MRTGKIVHLSKSIILLISLVIFLVVLAPSKTEGNEEGVPFGASLLGTAGKDPAHFLKDFAFVPGSAMMIEDHYILALYENSEKELYALAVFTANCDQEGCAVKDLVVYSIFDSQGQDIRLANTSEVKSQKSFFFL